MTLKRTPLKRKLPAAYVRAERIAPVHARLTVKVNMARITDEVLTIAKEAPVRSEPYRRLVAAMPCIHCGYGGPSQAAHADQGKGSHIKSDDRTCYPACAPRVGDIGCHALIGSTGTYTRDARRELEAEYAARTRAEIRRAGLWPRGMAHFEEQTALELAA